MSFAALGTMLLAGGLTVAAPSAANELQQTATDFQQACEAGNQDACRWLANFAEDRPSLGIPYSHQVAILARSCRTGAFESCVDWGRLLSTGPRLDRDWDRIGKLWTESCEAGVAEGCRLLAHAYALSEVAPRKDPNALPDVRMQGAFDALLVDTARARLLARPFLGDHNRAEQARLILACADVSEEHWIQAIQKVSGRESIDPAYAVLAELIRERQAHSNELWAKSYVNAWARAGHPDLRNSLLFVGRTPMLPTPLRVPDAARLPRLLADWDQWHPWLGPARQPPELLPPEVVQRALELAGDERDPVRLLALRLLQSPLIPESLQARAHEASLKLVEALAVSGHDNPATALRALVAEGSPSAPLSGAEIDALERLSLLGHYDSGLAKAFELFQQELLELDPEHASERALAAAEDLTAPDWATALLQRVEATRAQASPADWKRLVAALHHLGEGMRQAGSLAELTTAAELLALDADQDSKAEEVRSALLERSLRWNATAPDALTLWPLPALQEEILAWKAQGENSFYEVLDATLAEATSR